MDARFSPMLATPADAIPTNADAYVLEPKFDGWRAIVHIADGEVTLYGGRNGKTYTGQVPYIEQALAAALPAETVIDGELIGAGGWNDVQSVMTTGATHVPSAISPALTLVAFDVLVVNGNDVRDLSYDNRRAILEMISWPTGTYLSPNGPATTEKHVEIVELGMEGSVIKLRSSTYTSGRRSPCWLKLKTVASEDCEIVGFEDGKNGRSGEVGAIIVKLPSGQTTTASGMTDKMRADMKTNPSDYLGKIVEIAHNGHQPSGKVRHPRFKRMRDDRTPAAPKPKRTPSPSSGAGKKRMRNYGAMGDAKLIAAWNSLNAQSGDAWQRHFDHMGTVEQHVEACRAAMESKGLPT